MNGKAEIHPQAFSGFGVHAVNSCDCLPVEEVTVYEYECGTWEWSVLEIHIHISEEKTCFCSLSKPGLGT